MAIFAIGDLHLSFDKNVEKPMNVFGPAWEGYEERIAKDWQKKVNDGDVVIVAGDISWGLKMEEALADLKWIDSLPGQKVLIKGNHDLWWQSYKKLSETFEGSSLHFLQNNCYMYGETAICGTRGWVCPGVEPFTSHDEKVYQREAIRLELSLEDAKTKGANEIVVGMHFPPTNEHFEESLFTELIEKYRVGTCVYGHLHNPEVFPKGIKGKVNGTDYMLISQDYLNSELISLKER